MAYMEQTGKKGSVLGLAAVSALAARMGNPQDKLCVIHVAGTNGKGSICAFLEAMYLAEGKRVGRYSSPTLSCYLERFQIDGNNMSEECFARLLTETASVIFRMEQEGLALPTAFEIETVIAFLYFLEQQVDIVILETGMGGREDATNIVANPLCTVFASIGMDHMQFLGDTVEQIAGEKAGIMKDGCPAVSYPNTSPVMGVLRKRAKALSVDLTEVRTEEIQILKQTLSESRFCYKGTEFCIHMSGEYQIYNAATAVAVKCVLEGKRPDEKPGGKVAEGLSMARWPGRFEVLSERPLFIRDGAHNVDGAAALKKSLQNHFTNEKIIFIIGVLKDKEYDRMMEILCPVAAKVFTVTPENERGLSASLLRDSVLPYCRDVEVCASVGDAVGQAEAESLRCQEMGGQAVIVAWGSLSYIGQIEAELL